MFLLEIMRILRHHRHQFYWLHLEQEELEKLREELRRQRQLQEDGYPWVAKVCRDEKQKQQVDPGLQLVHVFSEMVEAQMIIRALL